MSTIPYLLTLLAIVVTVESDLVCPGYGFVRPQEPCVDECSSDNDNCEPGKKCCYTPFTPCGYRCLVGKENIPKPGTCPSSDSDVSDPKWRLCDGHFCDVDGDCPCKQKCCRNLCGSSICIAPVKTIIKQK